MLRSFFPEGFSFFTRDPRELRLYVYALETDSLRLINLPNGALINGFGIIKKSRAQNLEIGLLLSSLRNIDWNICEENIEICLKNNNYFVHSIENENTNPLICGNLLLVARKPVPWAWSKNIDIEKTPSEFLRIFVECH